MRLTAQTALDLQLLNLPKHVSKAQLKAQYHKLAKQFHPDTMNVQDPTQSKKRQEALKLKAEEKFKDFNLAYERLTKWVDQRDEQLE